MAAALRDERDTAAAEAQRLSKEITTQLHERDDLAQQNVFLQQARRARQVCTVVVCWCCVGLFTS